MLCLEFDEVEIELIGLNVVTGVSSWTGTLVARAPLRGVSISTTRDDCSGGIWPSTSQVGGNV